MTPSRPSGRPVAVRAAAVHVPGAAADAFLGAAGAEPALPPEEAHQLLGRKGLLYKEPATRLALCAVHRALGLPPGRPAGPVGGGRETAVVVSSNYGNVQTVREVVATVRAGSRKDVSPLQAPNASSNVIASTVAIRYGLAGPNLMLCSGAVSGLQALRLGALLIRAGRAERAVVVGVEPVDDTVRRLAGLRHTSDGRHPEPRAAAACVVLEAADSARPGQVILGPVTHHGELSAAVKDEGTAPELRLISPGPAAGAPTVVPEALDLSVAVGETYGALGVLQAAVATTWLRAWEGPGAARAALVSGDAEDGWARAELLRVAAPVDTGAV
ncbi:beta-ketoacyl synthase N-terminal-like domain-containing protein [Streptomyces sp. NPDC002580]|uniref:beta-ketoacyl synthase N-terminal-like domain-containing protein n=1 Tax=Streptomyces sp. NPDC002580 TaxID=3364653 RepID=UPI0036A72589